jgi:hypothetical protein
MSENLAKCIVIEVHFWMASINSTRPFSESPHKKLDGWTRSNDCCWRPLGKRLKMVGLLTESVAVEREFLSESHRALMREGCRLDVRMKSMCILGLAICARRPAGRISHIFGLRGPCIPVDTACSSSLVALHLAIQSLRHDECEMALVAGVNLTLAPELSVYFCRLGLLSPSGRCRSFSADADGYVRGEGCGAVLLRRLADAQEDHAPIVAVIRGSAVNHDGRGSGLTVPKRQGTSGGDSKRFGRRVTRRKRD